MDNCKKRMLTGIGIHIILICLDTNPFSSAWQEDYKYEIDLLKAQNDSLYEVNCLKDEQIFQWRIENRHLMRLAEQKQIQIFKLKARGYERDKTIDHFVQHELLEFFTRIKTNSTAN